MMLLLAFMHFASLGRASKSEGCWRLQKEFYHRILFFGVFLALIGRSLTIVSSPSLLRSAILQLS